MRTTKLIILSIYAFFVVGCYPSNEDYSQLKKQEIEQAKKEQAQKNTDSDTSSDDDKGVIEPTLSGMSLLNKLRKEYVVKKRFDYRQARILMYSDIFNHSGKVSGIYTGYTISIDTKNPKNVIDQATKRDINCEHTFPQSKGAKDENGSRSDIYHLYPSKINVNGDRASNPFADIPDSQTNLWFLNSTISTSIPTNNIDAYSEATRSAFEPRESVKGDIARSVFYFYTMYDSADKAFFARMLQTLLKWNKQDPVSDEEKKKEEKIKSYQGNDNPYILDPTIPDRIWGKQSKN